MSRLQQNHLKKMGRREKNNYNNVLTTLFCVNESIQQSTTEQRLGPPASFGILFCTFYSLLELCGSFLMRIEKKSLIVWFQPCNAPD